MSMPLVYFVVDLPVAGHKRQKMLAKPAPFCTAERSGAARREAGE